MDQGTIKHDDKPQLYTENAAASGDGVRGHDGKGPAPGELSMEQVRKVWAARAARLAEIPAAEAAGESMQFIPLRLGCEVYAVDVQYVMDIRPLDSLTRVPRVPAWVAGVTNLRGRIYSVIDLQQFLGVRRNPDVNSDREAQAPGSKGDPYMVLIKTPHMDLVLLVDDVLPLQVVQVSAIHEVTGDVRVVRPEYVRGITSTDKGAAMVILDLPVLLADRQLIVHEDLD